MHTCSKLSLPGEISGSNQQSSISKSAQRPNVGNDNVFHNFLVTLVPFSHVHIRPGDGACGKTALITPPRRCPAPYVVECSVVHFQALFRNGYMITQPTILLFALVRLHVQDEAAPVFRSEVALFALIWFFAKVHHGHVLPQAGVRSRDKVAPIAV
jgi:hypothetical protein